MRGLIFNEESRQNLNHEPQLGVEGEAGAVDVVSANTERVGIIYDKYELLKQVRKVIAVEAQDIGYKVFIEATLGSMETSAWSVKVEAEQKSWDKEMAAVEAKVAAEQEARVKEIEVAEDKTTTEREAKIKDSAYAVAKAQADQETAEDDREGNDDEVESTVGTTAIDETRERSSRR